jgi:hypothetical protein
MARQSFNVTFGRACGKTREAQGFAGCRQGSPTHAEFTFSEPPFTANIE